MNKKKNIHVQIGDKVKVISGKQKGFLGTVLFLKTKNSTLLLDGSQERVIYRTLPGTKKPTPIRRPIFIHSSNVMLWDKLSNETSRFGYTLFEEKKIRYFKKSGFPV